MIRPYVPDDLHSVLDVWYRASLVAHAFLGDEFLQQERREVEERFLPMSETNVFELDGRVVGMVSLVGNEVGGLFVDPDYHRRGIGRALLDHALEDRGFLELAVFEANELGRSFYDAYGFTVVNRQINSEIGEPELRMRIG